MEEPCLNFLLNEYYEESPEQRREAMQEIEDGRFRIAQLARVSLLH